jgi:ADP-heptose:LPS heptosyltransferase
MSTPRIPQHLLVCRTDNIGDVVLTLPMVGYLKQRFPTLRIDFLCRGYAAGIVRRCTAVDRVILREEMGDERAWFARSGIDTVIFGKPDRRLAAAAKAAGVAQRVGSSHRWFHWLYCNRLAHFSRVRSRLHEAQLNFALLRPLGLDAMPSVDELPALYRLEAATRGEPAGRFNVVLHPKSNGHGREWPIGHFTALAQRLRDEPGLVLSITGSAAEGEQLRAEAPDLFALPNVRDLCGRMTLDELTGFIAGADGLVASGTGPLHMAAALGIPTLGLFPPIAPIHAERWGPVGAQAEVLCRPIGCNACDQPAACACMANITPDEVALVVRRWVAHAGRQLPQPRHQP